MSVNPIAATEAIDQNYKSYLLTTLKFADDMLQSQFKDKLDEKGRLVKGPILEATPSFVKGCSILDLINEGVLSRYFETILPNDILNRPLHVHQEKAIRKVVQDKRNIIVATGTGSGKTETFIIPILNALFREKEKGTLGRGGVRALLLYPMNALANDQLNRLRSYLKNAPFITFGRYTGETKQKDKEALEIYQKMFGENPLDNELISREQMWKNPPHILLTNYAMLEYLLLRPKDSVFFDGEFSSYWRFIVMDEVHTYSGAKGIETAMLIRRLKDRIGITQKGQIQCIGTSATLGRGREDFKKVVQFAGELFGEEFQWNENNFEEQDVVEGERIPLKVNKKPWGKPVPELYLIWQDVLNKGDMRDEEKLQKLKMTGIDNGIPVKVIDEGLRLSKGNIKKFLYEVLSVDERLLNLQEILQDRPRFLIDIVKEVMNETDNGEKALAALVDLAVQAQPSQECESLLPARYHVFVRAIEGAYIRLLPEKEIYLERRKDVEVDGYKYPVFEAGTCRSCGAAYLIGTKVNENGIDKLVQRENNQGNLYYYLLDQPNMTDSLDEDDEVEFSDATPKNIEGETYKICGKCGAVDKESLMGKMCNCGEKNYYLAFEVKAQEEGQIYVCPACGKRSSQGVVRRFTLGADAVSSVLSTALYKQIKPKVKKLDDIDQGVNNELEIDDWDTSVEEYDEFTGEDGEFGDLNQEKRKLLVFSDSRQDAAFFAPYLNRTYNQILNRSLIVEVLKRYKDEIVENEWRLQDLVLPLQKMISDVNLLGNMSIQQQKNEIYKWLMKELISMDRYINLGAFGLLYFDLQKPRNWKVPNPLFRDPWYLTQEEGWTLFKVLYDTIRSRGAVKFPDWVSPEDEYFYPQNRQVFFRSDGSNSKKGIISWNSQRYNIRLDYLLALAQKISPKITEDKCRDFLRNIYNVTAGKSKKGTSIRWEENLVGTNIPGEGMVYQLKYNVWAIRSSITHPEMKWYRCNKCKILTPYNIKGVCPNYRCDGHLEECSPEHIFKNNHYYNLYFHTPPLHMKAEEHTAQLTSEAAAELQTQFNSGEVQVLSCSTTFELGVDVGELEAVFMRNMPPSPSNYIQRAGRAGRSAESAAYVLTFAQRRPHDLTNFYDPMPFVAGQIKAPHISLSNEKIIKRHIYATAFSEFWRKNQDYFGKVDDFFFNNRGSGVNGIKSFLQEKPEYLKQMLLRIVPDNLHKILGLNNWTWIKELVDDENNSPLLKAWDELNNDIFELEQLKDKLLENDKNNKNISRLTNIFKLINTIKGKNLIGFLSTHSVLPKYGFPVDVVELQITHHGQEAARLQLERDLKIALSEYAPESQVVAGGKLWTSRYLKLVPNRTWERYKYAICEHCNSYHRIRAEQVENGSEGFNNCPFCGEPLRSNRRGGSKGEFIIPAFGFVADNKPPRKPGQRKPEKTYTSRVYYSGEADEEEIREINMGNIKIHLTPASHGKLAVINNGRGNGFKVCYKCGYSKLRDYSKNNKKHNHLTAWGQKCNGFLSGPFALGHEFETDILKVYFPGYRDEREGFWISLLYALLEGSSEALEIERQDLDGCLYPVMNDPSTSSLILFDDVPGGAGHVRRMADIDVWIEVLKAALTRMERCECGGPTGNSSCYGCLRNYRNQFCHDQLNRGMVIEFLREILL